MTKEQQRLLALCRIPHISWHLVAREAQKPGGLDRLLRAEASERSSDAAEAVALIGRNVDRLDHLRDEVTEMLEPALDHGARLTTVVDDDYPATLRTIFNLPPFLLYFGELQPDDALAVAVVGTREPSTDGLEKARRLARLLCARGVTVLSGLARGIDTAAHEGALEGRGRTVAVLGSGILRVYPPENGDLADRIADQGAVVSQFWPTQPPATYTFPRRNVVTSGLGQGTVVIEASATSGAKMQARLALQHGKKVFLPSSLVASREWARKYLGSGAVEITNVEDIVKLLRPADVIRERSRQVHQEALSLS